MRGWMICAPLLLAACAGGNVPRPLTDKQAAKLAQALDGKVAGTPVSCIDRRTQSNLTAISDTVLLYRVSRKLLYRNDLIGSCSGLARGDIVVTQSFGTQLCRGDMTRTVDRTSGMMTGACALGDFTPYRTPAE
ncbi:hypothetical protein J3E64_001045 [Sphingobium sp. OAS761]|uniref:hypothetical protein n=1 Tax=Sphingobium sp. OAS761 TaxID=2817901 RepID=UPI0020A108C8|nr:hypothetical protein [Sphingobium sp. OAS761]MCP1469370.1 hypothetical protein [Sphingobium sp. OAS761]